MLNPLKRYLVIQLDYDRRIRRALSKLATIVKAVAKKNAFDVLRQLLYVQHNFITVEIKPILISGALASRLAAFSYVKDLLADQQQLNPRLNAYMDKHYQQLLYTPDISLGHTWQRVQKANTLAVLAPNTIPFPQRMYNSFDPLEPGGASWPIINYTRGMMSEEFIAEQIKVADPLWTKALKWQLADDHPEKDVCNILAAADRYDLGKGIYPAKLIPPRPHFGCLCYISYLINNDLF